MASERAWVIQVTCDDCTGVDPMGCGDGEPWLRREVDGRVMLFETRGEAEAVARSRYRSPYRATPVLVEEP